MTNQRIVWNDPVEIAGWRIAGGFLAGILAIWLAGMGLHAMAPERSGPPGVSTDLLRDDATRPTAMRMIRFSPDGTGFIARDDVDSTLIGDLAFERDGFIVSTVRSLNRARRAAEIDLSQPYRLTRWNNGQILLEDPSTGAQIELSAFGRTNVRAFTHLFEARP